MLDRKVEKGRGRRALGVCYERGKDGGRSQTRVIILTKLNEPAVSTDR